MFEKVKTFFSQWLPIANQAIKRERDPVGDEEVQSESPSLNCSDAPVTKKLRLMPGLALDGEQHCKSREMNSKRELESHAPSSSLKWSEFLMKNSKVTPSENPQELVTVEVKTHSVKTMQFTLETVEDGTSLKKLEKLSNFGTSKTVKAGSSSNITFTPKVSYAGCSEKRLVSLEPASSRLGKSRIDKSKGPLLNGGITKFKSVHNKLFGSPKKANFQALMTSVLTNQTSKWAYNSCIRMDEKQSYQALLAQFCPKPMDRFSKAITSTALRSPLPGIQVVELDPKENEKLRETLKKTLTTPLVDLEKESSSPSLRRPSQIARVNSLEDALALSPQYSTKYVSDLKSRYGSKQRDRELMIEKEQIRLKVLEENRERFDEQMEQMLRKQLEVLSVKPVLDEREVEPIPLLPELTEQMLGVINRCLGSSGSDGEVLCDAFGLPITRRDLKTLAGLNWLNDQIINFYLTLIMERSKGSNEMPKVFAHNTFFYPKLLSSGHSGLKRWTRKVDLFEQDFILIPIHLGLHWCMAIISPKEQSISYYDSMGGRNMECLNALKKYMEEESLDKKKKKLDASQWKLDCVENIPQQMNGSDCGMFACKFAEYGSRRAKITFAQKDMPYFRRRMVYEIVTKELIHP